MRPQPKKPQHSNEEGSAHGELLPREPFRTPILLGPILTSSL